MKPRVAYLDFLAGQDSWGQAFARVKELGEGAKLGEWQILWIHTEPDWVQLKSKLGKRMVRRGDPLLIELTK